ncbi:MAG: M23 family metallopeptidase [Ferrovum sp.]|nr:M23 family metallopeptidase [Ferrovum sp.]NDU87159.1 M23 family metallopeptidase [Ferrovum sp.]
MTCFFSLSVLGGRHRATTAVMTAMLLLAGCATEVPAPIVDNPAKSASSGKHVENAVTVPPASAAEKSAAATKPHGTASQGLSWIWPLEHEKGSYNPKTLGVDVPTRSAQPVLAMADGVVSYVGDGISSYGLMIIVKHPNDYLSVYAHNGRVVVHQGQLVTRGQKIAETGNAPKTPWHFEIRHEGKPLNPLTLFSAKP